MAPGAEARAEVDVAPAVHGDAVILVPDGGSRDSYTVGVVDYSTGIRNCVGSFN